MSAPVASNLGKAPVKVAASQTIDVGGDGSAQPTEPLTVPKGALGKPETVVQAAPGRIPKGEGTKVILTYASKLDGDTFSYQPVDPSKPVPGAGGTFTCRLDWIDAPEIPHGSKPGQPFGAEAAQRLEELAAGKELTIKVTGQSKSFKTGEPGRDLCQVEIEGKPLDVALVKDGLAYIYDRYVQPGPRRGELRMAQAEAMRNKRGVWSNPNSQRPGDFRKSLGE